MFEIDFSANKVSEVKAINDKKPYLIKPLYYDQFSKQLFVISNYWSRLYILKRLNGVWQIVKDFSDIHPYAVRKSRDAEYLWICTRAGLKKLNTKTYEIITRLEKDGLPDNFVTDIMEEPNGDHWIVTSKGISYYEFQKRIYRNFTSKDGAYSMEYDWGNAIKLDDGRAIFAGTNGLTVFKPDFLNNSKTKPTLQVNNFTVNGKIVANKSFIGESKEIMLEPEQNSFAFNIVGIDFIAPKNIRVFYKLDGYEKEWITAENPAEARYTNIPEGDYTFMTKSGFFNEYADLEIKSYKIHIKTPFQRTWWFRFLVFAAICGLFYGFYRFRVNQLLRVQEVRNRISTDLHDEIGATLSGIGILSEIAKQKTDTSHPTYLLMGRINEDAQTIGNVIDDIVWSINPKNDELSNVISRMSRNAAELFDAKGIEYKIDTPEIIKEIKLSLEQRRDLYLIYKEAVNNLMKYSSCSLVTIKMTLQNKTFSMTIADNGKGFDLGIKTERNGLKNMKNRAKKLGGHLEIISENLVGTQINLHFKI